MDLNQKSDLKNSRKALRQLGQGMTEYIVIVALIAISAIGVFTSFGDVARNQVAGMANELSGTDAAAQIAAAAAEAGVAIAEGTEDKGLSSYNSNNDNP